MEKTEKRLQELFVEWKEAHKNESEDSAEDTCNLMEYKNKFAPDGLIGEDDQWDNLPEDIPRVLYVGWAPNWGVDDFNECFWVKNMVKENNAKNASFIMRMAEEQNRIAEQYRENFTKHGINVDVSSDSCELLKYAAFMNLSKRGCCDDNKELYTEAYVKKPEFRKLIKREIIELNPTFINLYGNKMGNSLGACKISFLIGEIISEIQKENKDALPRFKQDGSLF